MTTLRVGGVPEHFNLPIHLCIEEGLFAEKGIHVEWVEFPGGTGAMNSALRNDEIDVAIILTEGIIKDIANGNPSKIIQNYVSSPLRWGIHVAAKSDFHSIADLEDKRPAISRYGSGSHVMAYVQANELGWDTSKIECVVVNNITTAIEALTEGDADYFMWEHFTTKPLVDKGIFRRVGDFPTPWSSFVIAASDKAIENDQKSLELFLSVLNAKTKIFKTLEHIEHALSERYEQNLEDIKKWLSITSWSQKSLDKKELELALNYLEKLNMIDKKSDNQLYLTQI
ncbi:MULTISPECIES: substrate-binding domain-containing protein [Leeuwenhoekiella]|jgi:ABC-type nitrate/sulfonate/bicarbonate transport system substrate-binding protein|uniref:substrate-binding domain-containing protein n=1 Tax=Leeuwenhoekiella TaxID=283735 RepID=UPI000C558D97|nr:MULTISPECIES: substrate-binding domain-containing protein [Leeuwenhoekiella]MAO42045.1 ABC transporter substrate-binding protein [Leeuwenhoekiella sp.]MBQ52049.1 ABC transporter substrate-binding protein [Leeuwenhoekiella sp.]HCW65073.1 ABC transporter substrate-binding protein [Leeuwenhoekiella sp.]|tara:strand:+ start:602 stop:1453 length:852 start_codon:yes stop_codon:yes gene_type:complete